MEKKNTDPEEIGKENVEQEKAPKYKSAHSQRNKDQGVDINDKLYLKKDGEKDWEKEGDDNLNKSSDELDLSYHPKYSSPRRIEEILFEAMQNSKDGFEALSKAIEEASNQKLYFVQQLVERSQRVNKIVLEQLCNLDKSYHSLPEALEQVQKYKKNQSSKD